MSNKNVNPRICFESETTFSMLKERAFTENNLNFFINFQEFLEENMFSLDESSFLVRAFFYKNNLLQKQKHEGLFEMLVRKRANDFIDKTTLRGLTLKSISFPLEFDREKFVIAEDRFLAILFLLMSGNHDFSKNFNNGDYYYFYVRFQNHVRNPKIGLFWFCNKQGVLDCKGTYDLEHKSNTLLYLESIY
jgi:hypothetical protein